MLTKRQSPYQISHASLEDWSEIRDICCLTGNSGNPIEKTRWKLFSDIWIGPYQRFAPKWCTVAKKDSRVMGYITGCPNTIHFEFKKKLLYDIPLSIFSMAKNPRNSDAVKYLKRTLHLERSPSDYFSKNTKRSILNRYPAHLHINLREEARREGLGALLISELLKELKAQYCPGIHVFCGKKPVPFYQKNGFEILETVEIKPGIEVFFLAKTL